RISSGLPAIGYLAKNRASALCQSYATVSKTTQGGAGGPFTIAGAAPNANGFASQGITTAVAGTPVSGATQTLTAPGVVTDLQEGAPIAGYTLSAISCTGLGTGGTATANLTGAAVGGIPARSVRLDAAATASGSAIACAFVNTGISTIQFTKALAGSRVVANDQFTVAIRTGGVSGVAVSSTTNSTTAGAGSTVTGGTTGSYSAAAGTAYTLTEAAASGANLADYSGALSCVDTAGVQTSGLPSAEAFNPAVGRTITPVAGAALSCTLTNTSASRITLQKAIGGFGRLAASDQFTVDIRTGGVAGTVVNSTANSTTLGIGASVTAPSGSTGVYTGAAATAYTLNEAMAVGSASTLAKYISTLSCTNVGGSTNVTGFTSLPLTFTPAGGDNVVCTVTNTAAVAVIAGQVFLDSGVSSGMANDGVINGGEAGLASITVRLTNCAATVHASGVTDGTGAYNLSVPTGTANGAALCVEQTNQGTRVSTGASVGSTALPSGAATSIASTTYTYTRNSTPDRIAFTYNGTGHSNLNFGDVDTGTFATNGSKSGLPDTTVTYPHTFTAGTSGIVSFAISATTSAPTLTGWSEKIFADPGCTGTLLAGAAQLYPPAAAGTSVVFGQKVCVIMQEFIPGTGQVSYSNDATVQASFSYDNASPALPTASYMLHDITNVGNSPLELKKEVRNVTQGVVTFGINNLAKSGDTLEYQITYTNNAVTPISNLVLNDTTPGYTTFVASSTGTTPATLTACTKNTPFNPLPQPAVSCAISQTAGSTGGVSWKFTGSLSPSGTGKVLFQVKVD
ncbi:MAG: conserved repeat domain protein, partial [Polaromonas sp.]|nr:conserved repeat domain protein [Polaromonas sp.]